jgi:hypothetical protein
MRTLDPECISAGARLRWPERFGSYGRHGVPLHRTVRPDTRHGGRPNSLLPVARWNSSAFASTVEADTVVSPFVVAGRGSASIMLVGTRTCRQIAGSSTPDDFANCLNQSDVGPWACRMPSNTVYASALLDFRLQFGQQSAKHPAVRCITPPR